MNTYQETLDYLFAQLPMFTRIGAVAYKKDLDNTLELLAALDNPHKKFKSIHIAGTNGKGSTSHMLAAILQANGYKTGLYTSPHLKDFRERIKIDGHCVSEAFVIAFTEKVKPLIERIQPSFFELTVAMAFEYFAYQNIDIAVIETGLGGRLDSTNVITPLLSVITNIGFDHVQLLGNTLPEIAFEKAGIIKPGIPVVVGEYLPETKSVFEQKAALENAPVYFAEDLLTIEDAEPEINLLALQLKSGEGNVYSISSDLAALYQQKNIRTVWQAVLVLKQIISLDITKSIAALQHVMHSTGFAARWQVIKTNPYVILDVGHNVDGIQQILEQVKTLKAHHKILPDAGIHIVMGMVKDKDITAVLSVLPSSFHYYFTNAHLPRAMPVSELQSLAAGYGLVGDAYDNVNLALEQAEKKAAFNDVIIVCGSVFVVGEVNI